MLRLEAQPLLFRTTSVSSENNSTIWKLRAVSIMLTAFFIGGPVGMSLLWAGYVCEADLCVSFQELEA